MGQKISIYLSDEALTILDELVEQRESLLSSSSNRSRTLDDLLVRQGALYRSRMKVVKAAVLRHMSQVQGAATSAAALEAEQDERIVSAFAGSERKPLGGGGGGR